MPSTYIGQRSFEKAYRFLLERNKGDHLITDNSVKVNIDHFYSETEQFIEAERKTFRSTHNIPEAATVLFLAPGSNSKEIQWSLPILNKTANEFIQEHAEPYSKNPNAQPIENFYVVIPTNESSSNQVNEIVKALS